MFFLQLQNKDLKILFSHCILAAFLILPYYAYSGMWDSCRQVFFKITKGTSSVSSLTENQQLDRLKKNHKKLLLKENREIEKALKKVQKLRESLEQTDGEEYVRKYNQWEAQLLEVLELERQYAVRQDERMAEIMKLYSQWGNKFDKAIDGINQFIER